MQRVKILIVEDEFVIAEALKIMLGGLGYDVAAVFTSGAETIRNFKQGLADIVFMDIHLADNSNGIDVAKELKKISSVPVIYLTKNRDEDVRRKAINETNAVDYLTKPFSKTDICTAIDFALKALKKQVFTGVKPDETAYLVNDSIFLKNGLGFKKIMISDIMFLEASGSYCKFTFKDNRTQIFSENLSYFGEKFAFANQLLRVHRSYIVNSDFIERIHENRLWITGVEIPIGSTYKKALLAKFRFV